MKAECLASSSQGNCFIFEFNVMGMPKRIMLECGISMAEINSKLIKKGIFLSSIEACLITHAHQDHCKSASKLPMPLFASKETLEKIKCPGTVLENKKPTKICDGLYVMGFNVEHDCEGSMGFVIKTKDECVIFINDHKRWTENLSNFQPDYVFIECNYYHQTVYAQLNDLRKMKDDPNTPESSLKEINIKISQHERNVESHCSLHGTIKGLEKLNLDKCRAIFLMHLSDRYANEYVMKDAIQNRLGIKTYVCKKDGGIK